MKHLAPSNKVLLSILGGSGILFIAFLSYFNQFAADDWFFIGALHENSAFEFTANWYLNYGGRWFSYFYESILLKTFSSTNGIGLVIFFQILFFHCSLYYFIRSFQKKFLANELEKSALHYSLLLSLFLWMALPNGGEFFTWLSSTVIYLNGSTLLLLLLSFSFNKTSLVIQIPTLILFSGTSELLVLAYLVFLGYSYLTSKTNRTLLLILLGIGTTFLVANGLSPGSLARFSSLEVFDVNTYWLSLAKSGLRLSANFLIDRCWVFPLVFFTACIWGPEVPSMPGYPKRFLIYGMVLVVLTLPALIILHDPPPIRIMALPKLAFLVFLFVEGIVFRKRMGLTETPWIRISFSLLLLAGSGILMFQQLRIAHKYSSAVTARLEMIRSHTLAPTEVLVLPALPPSGILYSAEITKNADHYLNRHLCSGLKLHYKIVKAY